MRSRGSRIGRIAVAAGVAVAVGGMLAACAPDDVELAGSRYVALGDSYASGYGVDPYTGDPVPECYQSERNYPHLVAAELELELEDRTCGGAVTANIVDTPQQAGADAAPVQGEALDADTDIVTVTIGGNDLGFAEIVDTCIAVSAQGPLLRDVGGEMLPACRDAFVRTEGDGELDELAERIDDVVAPRLDATMALIAERAPNAKVFVVGYPAIAPDPEHVPEGGCWSSPLGPNAPFPPFPENSFPLTDVDTLYLHSVQVRLESALREAAESHGATYVGVLDASLDHSACAPPDRAYVNGITIVDESSDRSLRFGLALGALHPNPAGIEFLYEQVADAIRAEFD